MNRDALTAATAEVIGGNLTTLPLSRLLHLITVTQHATDLLLNEIERRGELTFGEDSIVIVPYASDYRVETVLTRP
jgi:hypothetical protein